MTGGEDLPDCVALKPSQEEIRDSLEWIQAQDRNPGWPNHVKKQLLKLASRLGYGS